MDIYVQSRGVSQDYRWLKITEKGEHRQDPPIPAQVTNLIDSDAPSLVLGRFNRELILLVTGLEASQRTDNRNRKIRNSVAWVGQSSDEPVLRKLAVQGLRDELIAKIDNAVKSIGKEGFQVSFNLLQQLDSTSVNGNLSPEKKKKIGNLQRLKTKLADELTQYHLPEGEGMLVVVSGVNTREDFEKAGVWRGLSSIIDSENWEYLNKDVNISEGFINVIGSKIKDFIDGISPVFLIVILIISLAGNGFLYQRLTAGQNQKRDLENQVEELKNTKNALEYNLNKLEEELQFKQEKKQKIEAELQFNEKKKDSLQKKIQKLQRVLEKQANDLEKIVQSLKSESMVEKIK